MHGTGPAKDVALLQDDKLHPTLDGLAVIALQCMDALAQKKLAPTSEVLWDATELVKVVKSGALVPAGSKSQ